MSNLKSRRGAALILALIVVLVGGTLITVLFDFVSQYAFFSTEERVGYVDHTTLVSQTQAMKGRIIADNIAGWETRHVSALNLDTPEMPPAPGSLNKNDLRFAGDWYLPKEEITGNQVGPQQIEVEVYDMLFDLDWINTTALRDKDFPSSFRILNERDTPDGPEGEAIHSGAGETLADAEIAANPKAYGAYLVRAKLYDASGSRVVRTAEEVFVQVLPEPVAAP